MIEERDGISCALVFGLNSTNALVDARNNGILSRKREYMLLTNPVPTGDHWKVVGWVTDFLARGDASLSQMPPLRRNFVRSAAAAFKAGHGIILMCGSKVARRFRDNNTLRMQRGKVYLFIHRLSEEASEE